MHEKRMYLYGDMKIFECPHIFQAAYIIIGAVSFKKSNL